MAFHPYPQLIPRLCNVRRFGPSVGITRPAAWPWVAHTVSGLPPATPSPFGDPPSSDSVSLRLRQPPALASLRRCNSPAHSSISTPLLPRDSGDCLSTRGFRISFTPLPGCFSPFPHGTFHYRSMDVLSLRGWPPVLPTGFPVPGSTQDPSPLLAQPSPTGRSPSVVGPSRTVRLVCAARVTGRPPVCKVL